MIVEKIDEDKYEYNPIINCANDIKNSDEDKLIAHYTFDDFQEPTQNLAIDNGTILWTVGNLDTTITRTTINLNDKYLITSSANAGTFRFYVPYTILTDGEYYTLSYKYKILSGSEFRMSDWNDSILENVVNIDYDDYKYSAASGVKADYNSTFRFMDFYITGNTSVEIWDVQLEKKKYATPFTTGIRTGILKDETLNNDNITLSPTNTPKWIKQENNGYYEYDGIKNYIELSLNITNAIRLTPFTLSAWIKTAGFNTGTVLGGIISPGYGLGFYITPGSRLCVRMDNGSALKDYCVSDSSLLNNKFHHIVTSYDGVNAKLYVDGVEKLNQAVTYANRYTNRAIVGYDTNDSSITKFKGIIDDVKIYSRGLLKEEIKYGYDLKKHIYNN